MHGAGREWYSSRPGGLSEVGGVVIVVVIDVIVYMGKNRKQLSGGQCGRCIGRCNSTYPVPEVSLRLLLFICKKMP